LVWTHFFGGGGGVGHFGGRYLWHLPESENLVACWKPTPGQTPREIERHMISEFEQAFGGKPFANLVA
jgi:hypothetical protein